MSLKPRVNALQNVIPLVLAICFAGSLRAAIFEYVDFDCNEVSRICRVGDTSLYYPSTSVGDSLDLEISDDNLQFIKLETTPRFPAVMEASFAIWNGGWLPDDVLKSLPDISFEATIDLIGKSGQVIKEAALTETGRVAAGIIHITAGLPVRLGELDVYGVQIHVETTCLGDPLTNVPCENYHTFVGGPQLNGPIQFSPARIGSPRVFGDVNNDRILSAADIDLISSHVGTKVAAFDLNEDGNVTERDRVYWVRELAGTNFGDADLNRVVNFADFLALSGAFGTSGGWESGDFDGDGIVSFPDFLLQSGNFGERLSAVPEPSAGILLAVAAGWLACYLRGGRRQT